MTRTFLTIMSKEKVNTDIDIKYVTFSKLPYINNSIQKKLISAGFVYMDDLETICGWELFKLRGIGINKALLIQEVMKLHGLSFKDKEWIRPPNKSTIKNIIIKHEVDL